MKQNTTWNSTELLDSSPSSIWVCSKNPCSNTSFKDISSAQSAVAILVLIGGTLHVFATWLIFPEKSSLWLENSWAQHSHSSKKLWTCGMVSAKIQVLRKILKELRVLSPFKVKKTNSKLRQMFLRVGESSTSVVFSSRCMCTRDPYVLRGMCQNQGVRNRSRTSDQSRLEKCCNFPYVRECGKAARRRVVSGFTLVTHEWH